MIHPVSWKVAKMVLSFGSPIQYTLQSHFSGKGRAHIFCNRQAVSILRYDGYNDSSKLLTQYIDIINQGTFWADHGWKNLAHYFNPVTDLGLGPWPNACTECANYFKQALNSWRRGSIKKAFFYLGAAVHLVQDLCVPHHARGIAFCGHQTYEKWVNENFYNYAVNSEGIYQIAKTPNDWVLYNANVSKHFFPYISEAHSYSSYRTVTDILLPLAQQTTAGFFHFFLENSVCSS
ncbi:MAG: phospholipase [Peptococcaceae bacterium]|nr:MAG: phospholipase [Peptococcaceae bacterium]